MAPDAGQQQVELGGVGKVGAQIDPGLQAQEATGRILDLGQEDGNDREGAPGPFGFGLPVEGKLDLALLPSARACRADEDGDRTAVRDSLLQGGKPRLAGGKLVAVEKGDEPGLCQV